MPKISVIVPAYNAELTIRETIESVQKQTFSDWELIVVNDGSCDRTLEVVRSIDDERLKVFDYEQGGVSVARNRGISQASGEYIAFLDADDLWASDKLELQLEALQKNPEAGVAYSWIYFIDEEGKPAYAGSRILYEGNVYADLLLTNFLQSASNPLITKQALVSVGGFDPNIRLGEDWEFYLRLAAKWQYVVVQKYQFFYRQHSNSSSNSPSKVKEMNIVGSNMLERFFRLAPKELQYLKNHSLSIFNVYCVDKSLKYSHEINQILPAGQYLFKAVLLYPQILLKKDTLRLIIKYFLKVILPANIANSLLQFIKFVKNSRFQTEKVK
ncbi:MAG: glycosyltransferase [Scytonematopsis contorta HA4267-MV1]|jgi:glycosyltransferase involved in cell wall biosynthesis|nr:glycosyltransferase [Scytonematopsis contorta HA4267-MV1]